MREIKSEIVIEAPVEKVWSILMDFGGWKDWNPIVNQADGQANVGTHIAITMRGPDGKDAQKYQAKVEESVSPTTFRWRAVMMAGFMFTNDKVFRLEQIENGTRLVHFERFSGLMVPLFWGKLKSNVVTMLNSMNEALKKVAEKDEA